MIFRKFIFAVAFVAGGAIVRPVAAQDSPATQPWNAVLSWHDSLEAAQAESQRLWQPLFVYVGAVWCEPCRKLEQELGEAAVQDALRTWVRVHLDSDRTPDVVRSLGVNTVPALILLTPAGRVIASDNGLVTGDELIGWIESNRAKAIARVSEELADPRPPTAATLDLIMQQLTGDDPLAREAAVRRLLAHPKLAAARVVEAFESPSLAARLAAVELLEEWDAPIEAIDPWKRETISTERIEQLRQWASQLAAEPSAPATQPGQSLEAARRELKLLLSASSDAEAQILRERLRRAGHPLLDEIYQQLHEATTDQQRERLIALRYRIVASDRLALSWPGGLERLASTDASIRHQALGELAPLARAEDHRLLVELFGDPDPFIRERSLRLLRSIGGREPQRALIELLNDREPNVRAAVLNQLAETPDETLIDELVQYISREPDADLVVHAVRVLRVTHAPAALDALKELLTHANWRIRAEAVEAVHERVGRFALAQNTDVYAALIRSLEDEDGFVASRAVAALSELGLATTAEPLVRAAVKHPELAADVINVLSGNPGMALAALPQLKQFCVDANPIVRSAAIRAIAVVIPQSCGPHLQAGLRDADSTVRAAAASALLDALQKLRPSRAGSSTPSFVAFMRRDRGGDVAVWLDEFRAGKHRPKWTDEVLDDLRKLLGAESVDEQVAASLALIALAHEDEAMPRLLQIVEAHPARRNVLSNAIPWLPWEKRLGAFEFVAKHASGDQELMEAAMALASVPDPRAAAPLWDLLSVSANPEQMLSAVYAALTQLYLGETYAGMDNLPQEKRDAVIVAANEKVADGTELQKTVALALLAMASPEQAAKTADSILQDKSVPEGVRRDALHILLVVKSRPEAERMAIAHLADPELRKIALPFLASDWWKLMSLRNGVDLHLRQFITAYNDQYTDGGGEPIAVTPPAGIVAEPLLAVLADESTDDESRAYAGYLLALLGERQGWEVLHRHWSSQRDATWNRLVHRAITAMNADDLVPVLEEIYRSFASDSPEVREFYWTIRSMRGENIMKLRKTIRDEVGMQRLR